MQIIKPDPVLIENTKTALRILEIAAKAAATALNHSSFPAVLVPEGGGARMRSLEPGEVVEFPPSGGGTAICESKAGGEGCIKNEGHAGDHAGVRSVWS